jgi:hypothetical protein
LPCPLAFWPAAAWALGSTFETSSPDLTLTPTRRADYSQKVAQRLPILIAGISNPFAVYRD